jgi:hypothetical protein
MSGRYAVDAVTLPRQSDVHTRVSAPVITAPAAEMGPSQRIIMSI